MAVPDFNAPKRSELLAKYVDKPVTRYTQFDGFIDAEADSFVHPDEDGDALFSGTTYELMGFDYGVRVLIPDNISAVAAARALTKIAEWVEEDLENQRRERDPENQRRRERDEPGDIPF